MQNDLGLPVTVSFIVTYVLFYVTIMFFFSLGTWIASSPERIIPDSHAIGLFILTGKALQGKEWERVMQALIVVWQQWTDN